MPVAVALGKPKRYELKTCPEGYVDIRRMSYGEKMQRQQMGSKMELKGMKGKKDLDTTVDLFNKGQQLFDFATCIVEHNLTDENEQLLDFKKPMAVEMLEGIIAEEIGSYIDEMNNFEASDDMGKSQVSLN